MREVTAFLINNLKSTYDRIEDYRNRIAKAVTSRMEYENQRLNRISDKLPLLFSIIREKEISYINNLNNRMYAGIQNQLAQYEIHLSELTNKLPITALRLIDNERYRLNLLDEKLKSNDPALLLKKGFSMTTLNGKVIRNADMVRSGDVIETTVETGKITSVVK